MINYLFILYFNRLLRFLQIINLRLHKKKIDLCCRLYNFTEIKIIYIQRINQQLEDIKRYENLDMQSYVAAK